MGRTSRAGLAACVPAAIGVCLSPLMNAYVDTLLVHSWLRWVVVVAVANAGIRGLLRRDQPWNKGDRVSMLVAVISMDVQLLMGLLLYFGLSPFTPSSFAALGASMKDHVMRFWAVEHATGMILALIAAHVTSVKVRRAVGAAQKHKVLAIGMLAATALVLASMPWPFMPYGRPLFRGTT